MHVRNLGVNGTILLKYCVTVVRFIKYAFYTLMSHEYRISACPVHNVRFRSFIAPKGVLLVYVAAVSSLRHRQGTLLKGENTVHAPRSKAGSGKR